MFGSGKKYPDVLDKFVARAITTESEVEVVVAEEGRIQGYVVGFDSDWVQIARTTDLRMIVLSKDKILSYSKTGSGLENLDKKKSGRVRSWSHSITKKAKEFL